jgi:hypothetical protein
LEAEAPRNNIQTQNARLNPTRFPCFVRFADDVKGLLTQEKFTVIPAQLLDELTFCSHKRAELLGFHRKKHLPASRPAGLP